MTDPIIFIDYILNHQKLIRLSSIPIEECRGANFRFAVEADQSGVLLINYSLVVTMVDDQEKEVFREGLDQIKLAGFIRQQRPLIPQIMKMLAKSAKTEAQMAVLDGYCASASSAQFEPFEIVESFTLADVTISIVHHDQPSVKAGVALPAGYFLRVRAPGQTATNSILDKNLIADAVHASEPILRGALRAYPGIAKNIADAMAAIDATASAAHGADVEQEDFNKLKSGEVGRIKKPPL